MARGIRRLERAGHLVLVGAGHAHLEIIARSSALAALGHAVTIVTPGSLTYSGIATGVLGGRFSKGTELIDVEAVAGPAVRFVRSEAVAIDSIARTVRTSSGEIVSFDVLSIACGSVPALLPGERKRIVGAKPIETLLGFANLLERDLAGDPGRSKGILVAGGGPTAVEIAANLAARFRHARASTTITLAAGGQLLAALPSPAAAAVSGVLERQGVELRPRTRVLRVEGGCAVTTDSERLPFDWLVNATGLVPHPLARISGLPVDADGAMRVDRHLRSVAHPEIMGGGDCVAVEGWVGPHVGVHAVRQGTVLRSNIEAALRGVAVTSTFEPQRRWLWIMNLGDGTGLAARGDLWWHGRSALWLKDRIDRRFLSRWRRSAGRG